MRKIYSLFLVFAMCFNLAPSVYAGSLGEIDLSRDGRVCITDTGYITNYDGTYDSSNEIGITDEYYRITGTIGGDTPIEIRNNSDDNVTYDIWFEDVNIQTDTNCPAISIINKGTGYIKIYIRLAGDNTIISDGYPPFYVTEGDRINIGLIPTAEVGDYTIYNKSGALDDTLFKDGQFNSFAFDGKYFPNEAIDTINHDCGNIQMEYNDNYHWNTCPHYSEYRVRPHEETYEATCTSKAYCSVCNQNYGEIDVDAHDWLGWDYVDNNTHERVCSHDILHKETGTHTGGEANCSYGAICDDCNDEYTALNPNNHDWYDWESISDTEHKRVCYIDSNHTEVGSHTFVNKKCTVCNVAEPGAYTNTISGDLVIDTDNGGDNATGTSWTTLPNNGIPKYRRISLDNLIIDGDLVLPNTDSPSNEIINIIIKGNCRITGAIRFENSNYRTETIISGDGSGNSFLDIGEFIGTGNGDKLHIHTDTEIDGDLFLGASGGMDSHLEIKGATLNVDGDITLIEELHLMKNYDEPAKFIVHGHLLMHNTPVFNLEDNCEIHIMGDGNPSFYVESSTEPNWYQTLLDNNALPVGYSMKNAGSNNNYFSLHDENNNVVTGVVTLKNKPNYNITVASEATKCTYTVTTGMNGANSVYTIEDDTVVLDVIVTDTDYQIGKVEKVVGGTHTELTASQPGKYEIIMPASDIQFVITLKSSGTPVGPGIPPQPPVYDDYDPSYRIEIDKNIANGKIKSNKTYASSGEKVKLNITPDYGYDLVSINVTRSNGKEIELTRNEDGTYSFRMPSSRVKVTAEFKMNKLYTELCPKDETCPIWPYLDMNTNEWFHDGVHYCIEDEIMVGYGNGIFQPNTPISRAMIVTMLWRLEGSPYVNYLMLYEDIEYETWYTEALRWASSEKLVKGYSSTSFGPNDILTREQMAIILWNYAKYKGQDVSVGEDTNILSYEDAFDISEWAIPAIQWACGTGILKGDNGYIMPSAPTTRTQTATLFHRFLRI